MHYSAANIREIVTKSKLGKLPEIEKDAVEAALAGDQIRPLLIKASHARAVSGLPLHHSDPFDRLRA